MTYTELSIIIHTDKYAGNFEREMASFLFGLHEDHFPLTAEYLVKDFQNRYWKEDYVFKDEFEFLSDAFTTRSGEYGYTCVSIHAEPDGHYNNVEIFLDEYVDQGTAFEIAKFATQRLGTVWKYKAYDDATPNEINILGISIKTVEMITNYERLF